MRLALVLPTTATASLIAVASASGPYNPQYIVLSTNGQVVDVDPQLYFPLADSDNVEATIPSIFKPKQQHPEPIADATDAMMSDCGPDLSHMETESVVLKDAPSDPSTGFCHQQEMPQPAAEYELPPPPEQDEDEFAHLPMVLEFSHEELYGMVQPLSDYLDSELPGVQGSILFAELYLRWQSCLFVAFIGYLVYTIPLWSTFSKSQKGCLIVAFSSAFMYQFAAVSWCWSLVSPELMVGLSSLITRMISLGMVPITTTSFIGRAREICQESSRSSAVATTTSSRHRRHRARSS